jgi:hypothetical protein
VADKSITKSTGRGGKNNFPAAQIPDTDPGDNTKFLSHALAIRNMPPIEIADPVQVRNRINEYFALCAENDMKPSATGFRNALRIGKTTLWEWRQGSYRAGTHQAIICEAYDVLEALWEDYMQNGKINPVSGIFLGKNNFGYQDKQEYVLTPSSGVEAVDAKTIEAKYAELPEG